MPVAHRAGVKRGRARRVSARARRIPSRAAARRVPAAYKKIKFGSRRTIARSLASVRMSSLNVGSLLDIAKGESAISGMSSTARLRVASAVFRMWSREPRPNTYALKKHWPAAALFMAQPRDGGGLCGGGFELRSTFVNTEIGSRWY